MEKAAGKPAACFRQRGLEPATNYLIINIFLTIEKEPAWMR
jgi:hypothetical protein